MVTLAEQIKIGLLVNTGDDGNWNQSFDTYVAQVLHDDLDEVCVSLNDHIDIHVYGHILDALVATNRFIMNIEVDDIMLHNLLLTHTSAVNVDAAKMIDQLYKNYLEHKE